MKKTILGLAAAAMLLSFASCKKDYTCTCSYTMPGATTKTAIAFPYDDQKRSDAHDACDAQETIYRIIDSGAECEIGD